MGNLRRNFHVGRTGGSVESRFELFDCTICVKAGEI